MNVKEAALRICNVNADILEKSGGHSCAGPATVESILREFDTPCPSMDENTEGLRVQSIQIRISIDSTGGTPAIASMLKRILEDHGATVAYSDKRIEETDRTDLRGLRVFIDRLTWVKREDADRWEAQ
jgi:hypothetical protein